MVEGWQRVCEAVGHSFVVWNPLLKPAFDAFDEYNPQVFIQTHTEIGRDLLKCLREWHRKVIKIDGTGSQPAFDDIGLRPGSFTPSLACDVMYVGNYRPDKKRQLDRYMLPILDKFKVKIFGHEPWPYPQYLGSIGFDMLPHAIASAKVCLDIPQTQNITERFYQISGCGGFCISANDIVTDPLAITHTIDHFLDKKQDGTRQSLGKLRIKAVLRHDTYWHRVADMFNHASLRREANTVMEAYEHAYSRV